MAPMSSGLDIADVDESAFDAVVESVDGDCILAVVYCPEIGYTDGCVTLEALKVCVKS